MRFQLLRLLLKLRVRLLQFDLLLFEPRLRLLQGPTLFLEFFVRDPQFLALHLQLFRLSLGFLQKVLQLTSIVRRTNGGGDRAGCLFKEREDAFIHRPQEAELDHSVHVVVDRRRGKNQVPRLIPAKRRAELQIVFRHVVDDDGFALDRHLSEQTFTGPDQIRKLCIGGDAVGR